MILPVGLALTLASGIAPATARWAQDHERKILAEGAPLAAEGLAIAAELGIDMPEEIRVMEVEAVPLPLPRAWVQTAQRWGLPAFEPAGMTLGKGIYVLKGHWRVLRHELVHVRQYQQLGGIEPFMRRYLCECLIHGYAAAPLEREAREEE